MIIFCVDKNDGTFRCRLYEENVGTLVSSGGISQHGLQVCMERSSILRKPTYISVSSNEA